MRYRLFPPAVLVLLAGCAGGSAKEAPVESKVPVRLAAVTREAVSLPITAAGTLGAKEEIQLGFKIGGVIDRVLVDAGQDVRPGQLLAQLRLAEADAAVARAGAAAENAERELGRAQRLYTDSVVTLAQLQAVETAAEVARADLATARFNHQYARIVAPSAGVVLRRNHEPGELVDPGDAVLVLASRSRGNVFRVGLADRDVVRVRVGDSAVVRFEALPGREFEGRVSQVGAAAEAGTGTYLVDVQLPAARELVSDLVGTVEIQPASETSAILIPLDALLEADGDRGLVYTVGPDGRAVGRQVTIGFIAGDRVAIASGLDGTKSVITQGATNLRDGSAVEVVP
jgi:multidrug efflux system membrane fusion protein